MRYEDFFEIDYNATSDNIYNLMEKYNIRDEDCASLMLTEKRNLWNWKNGKNVPRIEDFLYLSKLLTVSIDELVVYKYQTATLEIGDIIDELDKLIKECVEKIESNIESEKYKIQYRALCNIKDKITKPVLTLYEFIAYLPLLTKKDLKYLMDNVKTFDFSEKEKKKLLVNIEHIINDKIKNSIKKQQIKKNIKYLSRRQYIQWDKSNRNKIIETEKKKFREESRELKKIEKKKKYYILKIVEDNQNTMFAKTNNISRWVSQKKKESFFLFNVDKIEIYYAIVQNEEEQIFWREQLSIKNKTWSPFIKEGKKIQKTRRKEPEWHFWGEIIGDGKFKIKD